MIPLISKRSAHGRGPGALRQVGHRRSPRSSGHRHDGTVSVDLSGELSVVKRCALITHGGGGDDDMTQRHPGSTAPAPPQATKVCAPAAIAFSMCSTARDAPTPGWNTARETLGWVRTEMSAPPNSRENLLCARWVTSGATMTSGKAHHHPLWEQLVQDERAGRHQRDGARIEDRGGGSKGALIGKRGLSCDASRFGPARDQGMNPTLLAPSAEEDRPPIRSSFTSRRGTVAGSCSW